MGNLSLKLLLSNFSASCPDYMDRFSSDFRWDDDVVFKNCAKDDKSKEKKFINDTLRSEFHKKFMEKYVK